MLLLQEAVAVVEVVVVVVPLAVVIESLSLLLFADWILLTVRFSSFEKTF